MLVATLDKTEPGFFSRLEEMPLEPEEEEDKFLVPTPDEADSAFLFLEPGFSSLRLEEVLQVTELLVTVLVEAGVTVLSLTSAEALVTITPDEAL